MFCVSSGLTNVPSADYWFIGGPLLLIAGIFEFILGNTFTYVVFISYGKQLQLENWSCVLRHKPFQALVL